MITVTFRLPRKYRAVAYVEVPCQRGCAETKKAEKVGAPIGAKSAPTTKMDYSVSVSAQDAPTPRTIGATSAHADPETLSYKSSPNRPTVALQDWPKHSSIPGVPKTLADELLEAIGVLGELATERDRLDGTLKPVTDREEEIRARIRSTHRGHGNAITLNLSRVDDRKPLWAELDEIAAKWGPLRAERKRVNTEIKLLSKHVEKLRVMIEREEKKRMKGHGKD